MNRLFISHSSRDDAFVRELRQAFADHGVEFWIDSRELRGGDPLWPEIQKAIENASGYVVVVTPDALQSKWIGRELRFALEIRELRGLDHYPVVPISLDGTRLGVLEEFFDEEPLYVRVSSAKGEIDSAVEAILVALRTRPPSDVQAAVQPHAEPVEELVLELSDLKFNELEGGVVRRASARARLVYEPATPGRPDIQSRSWRFIAPLGPIEAEELRWYLEKYAIWPSFYFRDRARKVEEHLVKWGQLLYESAIPLVHTADVMGAWARIDSDADRRFSVYVDTALEAGAPEDDVKCAREVATLLLGLPWELLHDGDGYLFQGKKAVRVRRRLPNYRVFDVPVVSTPVRILLVTARPEDKDCAYIDHRASALPLVEAMESLPGLVAIHLLNPPTLPALHAELERARNEKKPYHVVHFDGHGVFTREAGLGGLCFENPDDAGKLEMRRHVMVSTSELGPLLRDHRIPLVFLEACQTAQAEKASESVASELLQVGVASVVAMSHAVLVETARRFVQSFYEALADGKRVGDAMLAGQRALKDDTFRENVFGAGQLRLEDWFVPVLYQEKDDPQLFRFTPAKQTQEDFQTALATRLGDLPPEPATGFVGRSRELLALQRLLRQERYAVVRGQGGEGKTALATEFARWMVRSRQVQRAAFVSVEIYGNERAVVDALGKQLVSKDFSAAGDLEEAIRQVERALREQAALLVIDNMESVLLPPFMVQETPEALSQDAAEELKAIFALCQRLLKAGETRLVFTSREALPSPFDGVRNRCELHQLNREDAVKLIERVLNAAGGNVGSSSDAAREEIEQLVDAVHCHARTLALLAPSLRERGVDATRKSLIELMADLDKKFPGRRHESVFASVELSLRRMSPENRERARVLALFHGGVQLGVLHVLTQWEIEVIRALAAQLIETGLATPSYHNYLTLNPALCIYLRSLMQDTELEALTARWIDAMYAYAEFLAQQSSQDAEVAVTLTLLELPNLFALLELVQASGVVETTVDLATTLYSLVQLLGKPRLLDRLTRVRDEAAAALGDEWNHTRFATEQMRIEQYLTQGMFRDALSSSQRLLERARSAGEEAYPEGHYDLATANFLSARVFKHTGQSEEALVLLDEARKRFERIAKEQSNEAAKVMASVCLKEQGDCLNYLGRLDEAVQAYQESINRSEQLNSRREVAITKSQLANIRRSQRRYSEALAAYEEARSQFIELNEPSSVAVVWHQIGMVHEALENAEAAEAAYRQSLSIDVRLGDVSGQAITLNQLGNLYDVRLNRPEDAVAFYQQAADKYFEIGDKVREGVVRSNAAGTLCNLNRLDEARREVLRAIECKEPFAYDAEPWKTFNVLEEIEAAAGNRAAAQEARRKAIEHYLAYRRAGGENHSVTGRTTFAVTQALREGKEDTIRLMLKDLDDTPDLDASSRDFIKAIQAIINGSRDRTLADAESLNYMMAAEILFLIETLEKNP